MSTDIAIWKILQNNAIKLLDTPWTLIGNSVAARRTAFYIPELGIAFDCGLPTEIRLTAIFLSHCHYDHVRELPSFFLTKQSESVKPISLILPAVSVDFVVPFVTSAIQMTKMQKQNCTPNWKLIPAYVQKDQLIPTYLQEPIMINNTKFIIELFKCTHSVTCTGYGLIELRSKLQQKYKNFDGTIDQEKINDLKKEGINICEEQEYYHVCFLGDTDHHVLYIDKQCTQFDQRLEKYKTIIIECTYLEDDKLKMSKEKKHMLWKYLRTYIIAHPHITFILYHFSMCYTYSYIIDFFRKENISNIIPFVNDFDSIQNDAKIIQKISSSKTISNLTNIPIAPSSIDSDLSEFDFFSTDSMNKLSSDEFD